MENRTEDNKLQVLVIDIGGSHIKATVMDRDENFLQDYEREKTPNPPSPEKVMDVIKEIAGRFSNYDHITAGFPGYVMDGIVQTSPKLGNDLWKDFNLQKELENILGKPALVLNDADLQGLSLSKGQGVEMVITLGTGFGSAVLKNGILMPHLEMSQHPVTKKKNYNDYVGEAALLKVGRKKWNRRMKKVISILKVVFNYDHLFISGGNAGLLDFELDKNVTIEDNKEGIKGGAVAWSRKIDKD